MSADWRSRRLRAREEPQRHEEEVGWKDGRSHAGFQPRSKGEEDSCLQVRGVNPDLGPHMIPPLLHKAHEDRDTPGRRRRVVRETHETHTEISAFRQSAKKKRKCHTETANEADQKTGRENGEVRSVRGGRQELPLLESA